MIEHGLVTAGPYVRRLARTALAALTPLLAAASGCGDSAVPLDAGPDLEAGALDGASFDGGGEASVGVPPFVLLQANIGNLALGCKDYIYKLCDAATESAITSSVRAHAPDVVALQEVSTAVQCAALTETDPAKVCHPSRTAVDPDQARRVLGPDFTIVCNARNSFECVAVRTSFGSIVGCSDGAICLRGARTSPAAPGCSDGFTVSSVVVTPRRGDAFTIVNGHPPSGPTAASIACREEQVRRIFEDVGGDSALVARERSLITGDFNLDPYADDEASVVTFRRHVGELGSGKRFRYHSGIAEHDPPYKTGFTIATARVLDHVASDFLAGTCTTLGEAPGTTRLDGGTGTDHRALLCMLTSR